MAWWKTGEGDDITGDWPADIVAAALTQQFESAGTSSRLTLPTLLRAWQDALNSEPRAMLANAEAAAYRIVAETAPAAGGDGSVRTIQPASAPSELALRRIALEALRKIALAYRDAAERLPRATELADSLSFGLTTPTEDGRFAEGPLTLKRLVIEPIPGGAAS
jgi:hypothetical protein